MHFRQLVLTLETNSIQQTINFYRSKLGFNLEGTVEHEGQLQWCFLVKDSLRLMFTTRNAHQKDIGPVMTGNIYFFPEDVDIIWEKLKNDCEIVYPIENFSYGMREFAIKDNNGYTLSFGKSYVNKSQYDKFFPASFTLETPRVLLRLLTEGDYENLLPLSKSPDTWKYFTKDLSDEKELRLWILDAIQERVNGNRMPFVIIDKDSKQVCGSTSYGNISFPDKRIEIGWSWLGTDSLGSGVNRHAKFALLSYAFEVMQMERVEIKTDFLNERSKAALLKVGMRPEGVLRNHTQMHSGRRRDSIYFSIIKSEWEERKQNFFYDML